jgi:hypothetical protein
MTDKITGKGRGKGKSEVHSRTGHECPEVEEMYSFTLSLTSALDVVGRRRHAPAPLLQALIV